MGIRSASNDIETVNAWWREYPQANVAIYMKDSGLVGLDVDVRYGGDLDNLPLTAAARLTPTVRTGSKGIHLYWEAPPNLEISQSTESMPQGIDIRYDGYLVAPPSLHPSGRRYQWLTGRELWNVAPLPLPMSLLPHLKLHNWPESEPVVVDTPPKPVIEGKGRLTAYVEAAVREELDRLAQTTEGNRNNALNRAAYSLGQLVAVNVLSRAQAEEQLKQTALAIGLGEREIEKTIASGINAGLKNPRRLPDFSRRPRGKK